MTNCALQICKPKLDHKTMLFLEEDKLRVVWSAADIEVWLKSGRKNSQRREIVVDSYEITIFPAESVNNTQTVPASDSGVSSSGSRTGPNFRIFCIILKGN
jgi:hypothetical protein